MSAPLSSCPSDTDMPAKIAEEYTVQILPQLSASLKPQFPPF